MESTVTTVAIPHPHDVR